MSNGKIKKTFNAKGIEIIKYSDPIYIWEQQKLWLFKIWSFLPSRSVIRLTRFESFKPKISLENIFFKNFLKKIKIWSLFFFITNAYCKFYLLLHSIYRGLCAFRSNMPNKWQAWWKIGKVFSTTKLLLCTKKRPKFRRFFGRSEIHPIR